jgi:hypothetical protein
MHHCALLKHKRVTAHIDIPPWKSTSPQMASKVHKSIKRSQSESKQVTS